MFARASGAIRFVPPVVLLPVTVQVGPSMVGTISGATLAIPCNNLFSSMNGVVGGAAGAPGCEGNGGCGNIGFGEAIAPVPFDVTSRLRLSGVISVPAAPGCTKISRPEIRTPFVNRYGNRLLLRVRVVLFASVGAPCART